MNSYYLTLIINADLDEKARVELLSDVKKKILGSDGKIEKEDLWGVRDLAYPIMKQVTGYYVHYQFQTDPKIAKTIDKNLKVEEDILRYLLVRV